MTRENSGQKTARRTIKFLSSIVDLIFIAILIVLITFASYAKWDSEQLYTAADPIQYIQYKPSPPDVVSFEELQKINPDVLGWLTVYDTNIDYPVVQSKDDNDYYLNHNPKRDVEGSGSIFLDYRNSPDFTDFNAIIYGHHMAQHKMFGDLDLFLNKDFFNSHEFGNLIYHNENHGLQFVAMLQVDAYDSQLYRPGIKGEETRLKYINHIYETARYIRGVENPSGMAASQNERQAPITPDNRIVLLSTCSADITNGRFILVAKILDHPVENPFPEDSSKRVQPGIDTTKLVLMFGKLSAYTWILILVGIILLILILYLLSRRRDRHDKEKRHENS